MMCHPIQPLACVQAVLFDLDGTLVDSAPDLAAAADQMRISRGLASLPFEDYRPMAGAGARGLLAVALGISPEHADYARLREEFFTNYEARLTAGTHVFEGVATLLAALSQQGLPWGIVTNKMERFGLPLVQAMPVLAAAGVLICGDTTAHAKPHPLPLLEAARRLGVAPHACVYVGDDQRDIVAGKSAGMATVAACYGYLGAIDLAQWQADRVIKSPLDLLQVLASA
jgi:2-phosphoglycolate phosphatase